MKVGIANFFINNLEQEKNKNKILNFYKEACEDAVDLVIFQHSALSGFNAEGIFQDQNFLENHRESLEDIILATKHNKTEVLLSGIYFEEKFVDTDGIMHKQEMKDCIFHIKEGFLENFICRKNTKVDNLFEEYKYYNDDRLLRNLRINKNVFSILLSDDIYNDKNLFLIKDQKPDFVLCLDREYKDIDKKYLNKISNFVNKPMIYINSCGIYKNNIFNGEVAIFNEENELIKNYSYNKDFLDTFYIDYEDGSGIFIKDKKEIFGEEKNILKEKIKNNEFCILNVNIFTEIEISNIKADLKEYKNTEFITFNREIKNAKFIDRDIYIDLNLFKSLELDQQNYIIKKILAIEYKKKFFIIEEDLIKFFYRK